MIIVSGLPRSGTSMMMLILKNNGLDILDDNSKSPDFHNKNGYFEIDKIGEKIKNNNNFILGNKDKCLKLVSNFLKNLPKIENHQYKIIFMERNFFEIFISMEKKSGKKLDPKDKRDLIVHIDQIKKEIKKRDDFNFIFINYNNMIKDPKKEIEKLIEFLPKISFENSIKSINSEYYRNRLA
jgi:hypothetical protein